MAGRVAKIARGIARGLLFTVLGVIAVVLLAYAVLTGTPWGRGLVRDIALEQTNALIRGTLVAQEISSLGLFGIRLRGVEVSDPSGEKVISAESLAVELSPLALLLDQEIHIDRVALDDARVDLADLSDERGAIAAFALREPSPPEPDKAPSEPPVVVVSSIELDDVAVSMEVPDYGVVGVEQLALRGSFELRNGARAELKSLSTQLVRDHQQVGAIESAQAHWEQEGRDSTLTLRGRLAGAALAVDARARMPNDPAFESSPLEATVVLDGADAELLRALGQRELAAQLKGKARIELKASGTVQDLDAQLDVASGGGDVHVTGTLRDRDRLELHVASDGLTPGKLWAGTPDKRIALDLTGQAQLKQAPDKIPFEIELKSGSLAGEDLPTVHAQGRVEDQALCDLILNAQGRGVTVELSGDASAQKLDLHGTVRARDFELAGAAAGKLDADITLVGPPTGPRLSVSLQGSALRYEDFVVDRLALDALGGPDAYTISLNGRAPDGKVELQGRVELQERVVQVDANARGALRKRPFRLQVRKARIGYGGTIEVERAELEGMGQSAVIRGRYGGSASDELALDAQLDLEALADALKLETKLQGEAEVQLRARGTIDRPRAELSVSGEGLGLNEPGRERPTVELELQATLDAGSGELTTQATVSSGSDLELSTELAARFNAHRSPWYRALAGATLDGKLALDALSTEWLEKWLLVSLPMRGRVLANAAFSGTVERPELELTTQAQLRPPERDAMYEITASARYADAALELDIKARDAQGQWLSASASLEHPAPTVQRFAEPGAALADEAQWSVTVELAPRDLGQLPLDALTHKPLDPEIGAINVGGLITASHAPHEEPSAHVALGAIKPLRGSDEVQIGLKKYVCTDQPLELAFTADLARQKLDTRATITSKQQPLLELGGNVSVVLAPALAGQGQARISDGNAILRLSEIDLESLPYLCGLAHGRMSGRVDATSLLATDPKISVALKGKKLSAGAPVGIDLELNASATPEEAKLDLALIHGQTRSTITGHVPIRWQGSSIEPLKDQPFEADVKLDRLPVIALLPPSFAISRASGYLNGVVHADGTLGEPNVGGRIEPENLALTVTGLAQPLHGIEGRIAFSNRRLLVQDLVARDRDGSVEINGSAQLEQNNDLTANVTVVADSFPLRQQGQVAGELDANIEVKARMTEHKTRVEVELTDASAWLLGGTPRKGISLEDHPDIIDPRAEQPSTQDETPPGEEVPPEPIEIAINAEDSFWIRREDFAVKLSTKLELEIEDKEVRATGPIEIQRGYLQLLGQTFDIDGKSKVELTGGSPPDPTLDITASTVNRSSNTTISVHIGGRSTAPELEFFIDGASATVGEAAAEIFGRHGGGDDASAEGEAKSFVAGMMAGVMAMSARRELGDVVPILMIEPGDKMSASRVRAGFELDKLVPGFLEGVIRGVYVEGIFAGTSEDDQASSGVQGGVLLELYLPYDLVTSGSYGPGQTWSVDLGWEP